MPLRNRKKKTTVKVLSRAEQKKRDIRNAKRREAYARKRKEEEKRARAEQKRRDIRNARRRQVYAQKREEERREEGKKRARKTSKKAPVKRIQPKPKRTPGPPAKPKPQTELQAENERLRLELERTQAELHKFEAQIDRVFEARRAKEIAVDQAWGEWVVDAVDASYIKLDGTLASHPSELRVLRNANSIRRKLIRFYQNNYAAFQRYAAELQAMYGRPMSEIYTLMISG